MKTKIGLTDAQVSQMKQLREANQVKMKALRENQSLSRVQRQEQMMAMKETMKEQRKKIFTPDQLKKMEEMKKDHMRKPQAR